MTPQGPAVIQVIDMPTGLGPVINGGGNGAPMRKPGGINVVGAVMRRWWLVLLVFFVVGGGAVFAGMTLVKPQYEGRAKVSYVDYQMLPGNNIGIANMTIHRAQMLMNARDIPLLAAKDQELRIVMPKVYGFNLNDPAEQATFVKSVKDMVDTEEVLTRGMNVMDVFTLQPTPKQAEVVANAYAKALVAYCEKAVSDITDKNLEGLLTDLRNGEDELAALLKRKTKLMADSNFDANDQRRLATIHAIQTLEEQKITAQIAAAAAEEQYTILTKNKEESAKQKLQRLDIIEQEKGRDTLLKNYLDQMSAAYGELSKLRSQFGMTEEHPQVRGLKEAIVKYEKAIVDREVEIVRITNDKLIVIKSQSKIKNFKIKYNTHVNKS